MSCFATTRGRTVAHVDLGADVTLETARASLLPGLALARVDGKSPVEYLSEPARDRVRRLAIQLLHAAADVSLDAIARGWTGGLES